MTEEKKIEEGKCHNCDEEVDKLVCICYDCVRKGIKHETFSKCKVKMN